MTMVVDAALVVAALVDDSGEGRWALDLLGREPIASPHLMPAEATNILRRLAMSGEISDDVASMARVELTALTIAFFPFEPFGDRVWALRKNITSYDAWYVALAEVLDAPLATLDRKLARATGPRCRFRVPPP